MVYLPIGVYGMTTVFITLSSVINFSAIFYVKKLEPAILISINVFTYCFSKLSVNESRSNAVDSYVVLSKFTCQQLD